MIHGLSEPRALGGIRRSAAAAVCAALAAICLAICAGCGSGRSGATITVNSAADPAEPAPGVITLRSALAAAASGDTITFDRTLDGRSIELATVASEHTVLPGETYAGMTFDGYKDRDYGRSALVANKNVVIDASALPAGITLHWAGDASLPARVLAVYGNLTMRNVTVLGGRSRAEAIAGGDQLFTLARGAGLAVWGTATLTRCTVADCACTGDTVASRDRGTYGGGIYADGLVLQDCVISGNSAAGYGAAGGGIYSVGGAGNASGRGNDALLARCSITGNRVTAQHAYGGGVFSLSGGPRNLALMTVTDCTIARNVAEDNPALPQAGQYYYRGGGLYLGGGSLAVSGCTIVENEVSGTPAVFSGKPNIGGGGVAATVGNAHTVENVTVAQSIVIGNRVNGAAEDWFAGSILAFTSGGYNRFGVLDFRYILAPVPDWADMSRKHYPKLGDADGMGIADVLDVAGMQRHASIKSAGVDAGQLAVLWYPPAASAQDQVPGGRYSVGMVRVGYTGFGVATDDFLNQVILKLRVEHGGVLGPGFGSEFGDLTGTSWYGPRETWPTDPANAAWITFWRGLDTAIAGRLGAVTLGDEFWGTFTSGQVGAEVLTVQRTTSSYVHSSQDQRGRARPFSGRADIGAIEL